MAVSSWPLLATILCPKQDLHAWGKGTLSKAYFAPKQDYIWALIAQQHPLMPYQSYNHRQKCWTLSGPFSNSGRSNPSPHPTNNVGRVYPEFFPSFNFVYGWGRENCKKISKMMHCFKREPRNDRKICLLQHCPKDFCPGL